MYYKDKEDRNEAIKKVVRDLTDVLNNFSDAEVSEVFNEAMSREHRTLQQNFTRLTFRWIEHVASNKYSTDGRNQGSQETAKKVIAGFKMYLSKESNYPMGNDNEKPSAWLGHV